MNKNITLCVAIVSLVVNAETSSIEKKEQTIYEKVHGCVMLVNCEEFNGYESSGSAFAAKSDGKVWMYTNEHVVRGCKNFVMTAIDGRQFTLADKENIFIATNSDLVRFRLPDDTPALEWDTTMSTMGQSVVAYGNSGGSGVMTEAKGRVLGISANMLEIDCEIVKGNSGGPVVNEQGRVVSVATRGEDGSADKDWSKKDTRYNRVRRFGIKPFNTNWEQISWGDYVKASTDLKKFLNLSAWIRREILVQKEYISKVSEPFRLLKMSDLVDLKKFDIPNTVKDKLVEVVKVDHQYTLSIAHLNSVVSMYRSYLAHHDQSSTLPSLRIARKKVGHSRVKMLDARIAVVNEMIEHINQMNPQIQCFKIVLSSERKELEALRNVPLDIFEKQLASDEDDLIKLVDQYKKD